MRISLYAERISELEGKHSSEEKDLFSKLNELKESLGKADIELS